MAHRNLMCCLRSGAGGWLQRHSLRQKEWGPRAAGPAVAANSAAVAARASLVKPHRLQVGAVRVNSARAAAQAGRPWGPMAGSGQVQRLSLPARRRALRAAPQGKTCIACSGNHGLALCQPT